MVTTVELPTQIKDHTLRGKLYIKGLTEFEVNIVLFVYQGLTNKEIAVLIGCTLNRFVEQLGVIYDKLNISSNFHKRKYLLKFIADLRLNGSK